MIIKLHRIKKRYINRMISVLVILLFLSSALLSCFIYFKIIQFIKNIFVFLFGGLGSIIVFGSIITASIIKLCIKEIKLFKLNNDSYELDNCDMMRKKMFIIKCNELNNDDIISKNYEVDDCNKFCENHLRIVDSSVNNFIVKKRVRKKEDFYRHR